MKLAFFSDIHANFSALCAALRSVEKGGAELKLNIEGHEILMVHGSPVSDKDSIYPSITREGLRSKIGEQHPDILICGHTHIPFTRKVSGVLVVNA